MDARAGIGFYLRLAEGVAKIANLGKHFAHLVMQARIKFRLRQCLALCLAMQCISVSSSSLAICRSGYVMRLGWRTADRAAGSSQTSQGLVEASRTRRMQSAL